MITPGGIRQKAEKCYLKFLRAWLRGEDFFPLEIPADKGRSTDSYLKRKQELTTLTEKSKASRGTGYTLEVKEVNTRKQGIQSVVRRIFFETRDDFLQYTGKAAEFGDFRGSVAAIRSALPQLEDWIGAHPRLVSRYTRDWPGLLAVCCYFLKHPAPGLYLRELPVNVHTKFIEEHQAVLKKLLDFLLPPGAINPGAAAFSKRYKLRHPAVLFRLRFLDPAHSLLGMEELAVPVSSLNNLQLPVRTVIIIENLLTFLTFPPVPEGLAVWGKGFKAPKLKQVAWLHQKRLFYWGDMDPPGFEILSAVRNHFPHVISCLMDFTTYNAFSSWAVPAGGFKKAADLHLTPEEYALYNFLLEHPAQARLEQERISQEYVLKAACEVLGGEL